MVATGGSRPLAVGVVTKSPPALSGISSSLSFKSSSTTSPVSIEVDPLAGGGGSLVPSMIWE